jgi:hypothetical protein
VQQVSEEEILKRAADARAESEKSPSDLAHALWSYYQYAHSIYITGHNTAEVAKSQGALDGRELYPDLEFQTVGDFAKEFYSSKSSGLSMSL